MSHKNKEIKFKAPKEETKIEVTKNRQTHIKFNLSFVTSNKDFCFENKNFTDKHKITLFDRMLSLSKEDMGVVFAYDKKRGLEFIEPSSFDKKVDYNRRFDEIESRSKVSKFAVFRLCPNNNPYASRIIGKMVDKVFYILYLDLDHKMYKC